MSDSSQTLVYPSPTAPDTEWRLFCFDHPTNEICLEDVGSYYSYRISLAANVVFLTIFTLSFLGFVGTFIVTRRGLPFTIAMCLGVLCELLGYAGRIMSYENQWNENGFLMQMICLTLGPAFLAAGVYLCLRKIVSVFGTENSIIPPAYYTRIFIPCDVISLLLQAIGGAIASIASHNGDSVDLGDNIMIAGLAFQVVTLLVFIIISLLFVFRTVRRVKALGADVALDQSPALVRARKSFLFRAFIVSLALAAFLIFWRSVFRVAELCQGWSGELMARQDLFIGFEGVLITVSVVLLNIFHPAFCFKELMETSTGGSAGCCGRRRRPDTAKTSCYTTEGNSEPASESESKHAPV